MTKNMPRYRATDNRVRYTHPEGWTARVEILGRFDMPDQGWLYEVRTMAGGRVWCNIPERNLSDWTEECPNTWHAAGYGATGARCPECPALVDIEEVAAVDVLQETLRGLGIPHIMTLETPVAGTRNDRDARVAVRLPSGQTFVITVEES